MERSTRRCVSSGCVSAGFGRGRVGGHHPVLVTQGAWVRKVSGPGADYALELLPRSPIYLFTSTSPTPFSSFRPSLTAAFHAFLLSLSRTSPGCRGGFVDRRLVCRLQRYVFSEPPSLFCPLTFSLAHCRCTGATDFWGRFFILGPTSGFDSETTTRCLAT